MRIVLSFFLCLVMIPWIAAAPGVAQGAITAPAKGSPLRARLLDTARPVFEQEIGGPVEFVVNTLNVMDVWAYGDVKLQRPGGVPLDWSVTKYAENVAQGTLETEHNLFLLQDTGSGWTVVEYVVGPTDVAWDWWRQQRRLPAELFGASSADFPPPDPAQRPRSGG
jgi:hypothetical protein